MMALSPVSEESPNYEEVLQKSDPLSGASRYSGDSFESCIGKSIGRHKSDAFDSITDEHSERYLGDSFEDKYSPWRRSDSFQSTTNESDRNYESDSFESPSSSVHSTYSSESSSIESGSVEENCKGNDQGAPNSPELLKEDLSLAEVGEVLIEKWMKTLLAGNHRPKNLSQDHLKTDTQQESSGNESKALLAYCSLKIEHLRQSPKKLRQKKGQPLSHPNAAVSAHQSCPVPHELMNRLELQHIKETMNQMIKAEIHDPTICPDCRNKQAELAQCQFIRMKKAKLEGDLLHKKMEEYMYSKDLVTCIGDILQSLPKPSEEPQVIWERLHNSVKKTWP